LSGLKIAVVGKGGVGKTFIAGTLAKQFKKLDPDRMVIAIDADPSTNLYLELGIPRETANAVTPLCEDANLVKELTNVGGDNSGSSVFNLNPAVDGVVEKYAVDSPDGVRLLIMGTVRSAGQGCMCPANALLRALLRYVFSKMSATVILDMEAGLEHLGRGTIRCVDTIINVIEPSLQSIETSLKIWRLVVELGVSKHMFVANKVKDKAEEEFIERTLAGEGHHLDFVIPYDEYVRQMTMGERDSHGSSLVGSSAIAVIMKLERKLSSL